jgi:hypothetical protein
VKNQLLGILETTWTAGFRYSSANRGFFSKNFPARPAVRETKEKSSGKLMEKLFFE